MQYIAIYRDLNGKKKATICNGIDEELALRSLGTVGAHLAIAPYPEDQPEEKNKCRHGNDADTCGVCEDIRSGYVNTEG